MSSPKLIVRYPIGDIVPGTRFVIRLIVKYQDGDLPNPPPVPSWMSVRISFDKPSLKSGAGEIGFNYPLNPDDWPNPYKKNTGFVIKCPEGVNQPGPCKCTITVMYGGAESKLVFSIPVGVGGIGLPFSAASSLRMPKTWTRAQL